MEYTEVLDKQITRKQHYVPKAYLKNFSVSNQKSEQVYVVFANDENAKMLYEIQMNLSWRGWKLIN